MCLIVGGEVVLRRIFVGVVLTMLVAFSAARAGPFEDGLAAAGIKDYATALRLWQPLAAQGHAGAQYNLGLMHYRGQGVEKNYIEAEKWYRLAAAQGNAGAQFYLGIMNRLGNILGPENKRDYKKAVEWYLLAASQGHARAQDSLGDMYDKGLGVAQDYGKAVKWYRLAAAQGNRSGQSGLAGLYIRGKGVEQDYTRAYMWMSLSSFMSPLTRAMFHRKMTPAQIEHARLMAHRCRASNFKNCD